MIERQTNWAGNHTYGALRLHYPETVDQVQELVVRCSKLKALGSRHAFNGIADTPGDLVSLERFDHTVTIDNERRTALIDAGVTYGQLGRQLHRQGYALHNMASLPHITVAGACATATHGSGDQNGNLATAVAAIELVTANGEVVVVSRDHHGDLFQGAVVGLGGLGVVTKLALAIEPAFELRQDVYEDVPLAHLLDHFDAVASRAYSVSLFTDWRNAAANQVWVKTRLTDGAAFEVAPDLFGATPAPTHRHPIKELSAVACTEQMGIPGPWHERLPHFRMDSVPSSGEELQSEYFVPRQHAVAALQAVERLRDHLAPLLKISEVRTIAADTLWMSPCYKQACVGIHFTWETDWEAVRQRLPLIEAALAPFEARPHWGKLFTMPAARVQSLYAKLSDFQDLLRSYDPQGKFRNAFLDTYILGVE